MNDYNINDFTFEALCLKTQINTLAYVVGLVDSEKHMAANPDTARYKILYPLSHGEAYAANFEDLVSMDLAVFPQNYLPLTPVMFVQKWSPVIAMLNNGFEPISLMRDAENAPHAIASGIWKPYPKSGAKKINDCKSDEELFWSIMTEAFKRAEDRGLFVNIIAQPGWKYETMVGSLRNWSAKEIAKSGRILWKRTWQG